jgi:hypothetical protein
MAGINEKPVTSGVNFGGIVDLGNGLMLYTGNGAFTTTGTTVVINHPFGTGAIFSAQVTPVQVAGSEDQQDQPLYFSTATVRTTANVLFYDTTYGYLTSNTTGKATLARLASGSSGLLFSIQMIGRARH